MIKCRFSFLCHPHLLAIQHPEYFEVHALHRNNKDTNRDKDTN